MAPELVSDPNHIDEKADVWSMGVCLWEFLVQEVPHMHMAPQSIVAGLMAGNLVPEVCLTAELLRFQRALVFPRSYVCSIAMGELASEETLVVNFVSPLGGFRCCLPCSMACMIRLRLSSK